MSLSVTCLSSSGRTALCSWDSPVCPTRCPGPGMARPRLHVASLAGCPEGWGGAGGIGWGSAGTGAPRPTCRAESWPVGAKTRHFPLGCDSQAAVPCGAQAPSLKVSDRNEGFPVGFWRRHCWEGVLVPVSGRRQLHPWAQGHRLSRVPTPARALGWGVPLGCPPRATGQLRPPLCPCWVAARDPGVGLIASWLVRTLPFPAWGPHSSSAPGPRPGLSQRETSSVAAEPPVPGGRCGAGARSDCGRIGAGVGGRRAWDPRNSTSQNLLRLQKDAYCISDLLLHLCFKSSPSACLQVVTKAWRRGRDRRRQLPAPVRAESSCATGDVGREGPAGRGGWLSL